MKKLTGKIINRKNLHVKFSTLSAATSLGVTELLIGYCSLPGVYLKHQNFESTWCFLVLLLACASHSDFIVKYTQSGLLLLPF